MTSTEDRRQFDALLARLEAEGTSSGANYEYLRRRLLLFFDLHRPAESGTLTDIVLDRVARRLAEGTAVDEVRLYALGVARYVLQETYAREAREERALDDPTLAADTDDNENDAEAMDALMRCLEELGSAGASLILAYYDGSGSERIRARRTLAERLGLAINALRNRALRLRETLESCVRRRISSEPRDESTISATTQ